MRINESGSSEFSRTGFGIGVREYYCRCQLWEMLWKAEPTAVVTASHFTLS